MSTRAILWCVAAFMAFFSVLIYGLMVSSTQFECSHASSQCSYRYDALWLDQQQQTHFQQIQSVLVESKITRSDTGTQTNYTVVLQTHAGSMPVRSSYSKDRQSMEQLAEQIKVFLADPSQAPFVYNEDNHLVGTLISAAFAVAALILFVVGLFASRRWAWQI
jgi:hypothetical protein